MCSSDLVAALAVFGVVGTGSTLVGQQPAQHSITDPATAPATAPAPDGGISLTIPRLDDPAAIEQALADEGVDALVHYAEYGFKTRDDIWGPDKIYDSGDESYDPFFPMTAKEAAREAKLQVKQGLDGRSGTYTYQPELVGPSTPETRADAETYREASQVSYFKGLRAYVRTQNEMNSGEHASAQCWDGTAAPANGMPSIEPDGDGWQFEIPADSPLLTAADVEIGFSSYGDLKVAFEDTVPGFLCEAGQYHQS